MRQQYVRTLIIKLSIVTLSSTTKRKSAGETRGAADKTPQQLPPQTNEDVIASIE